MESASKNLLDLPISFFEYDHQRNAFANIPTQQTTLRRIVSTRYYQKPIEAIRTESDKQKQDDLKKHLPAFTLALLRHRKKDTTFEEKVIHQWPMLMGDVDKKDNPDVDMGELKAHLSRLPYVLLCAYSVRGGLWFVVRLPDNQTPDTLAAHFRYLQKLFSERFDIKLDSTKGGKSTDLRFVSFDDAPYFNDDATIFAGTYTPSPPKRREPQYRGKVEESESKLLSRVVGMVEKAGEGQRHETLLKAARLAGGFVGAGRLDEQNAVLALETAASEWPSFDKSQKTIRDGIRHGMASPIYPDVRQEYTTPPPTPRRRAPTPVAEPAVYRYADQPYSEPQRIPVEVSPEPPAPTPEPVSSPVARRPIKIPRLIQHYWTLFAQPPMPWNRIAAHKALMRCFEPETIEAEAVEVVETIAEWVDNPGSVLSPPEPKLDRLQTIEVDSYPPEWDQPSPPGTVPTIQEKRPTNGDYHRWQKSPESPFRYLGLNSLQP